MTKEEFKIEALAVTKKLCLENIMGPVIASSTSGDMEFAFSNVSAATPTSISLVSGYINVTMPASTKANLIFG